MKLDNSLSFLKDVSKNDQKLITGGAIVSGTVSGESFSGSARTYSSITVDGVTTEEDSQSFSFGPRSGSFSFSIESRLPSRRGRSSN